MIMNISKQELEDLLFSIKYCAGSCHHTTELQKFGEKYDVAEAMEQLIAYQNEQSDKAFINSSHAAPNVPTYYVVKVGDGYVYDYITDSVTQLLRDFTLTDSLSEAYTTVERSEAIDLAHEVGGLVYKL